MRTLKPLTLAARFAWIGLMKAILSALLTTVFMAGCTDPLPTSEPVESPRGIDLDDNETLRGILADSVELDDLRRFSLEGGYSYYLPNEKKPTTGMLYTGWAKELFHNGKVSRLEQFTDGKANGLFAEWRYNGRKEEEGHMLAGRKHGLHLTWYETGRIRSQTNYRAGKKDGLSTDWYENGRKRSEENFRKGKLRSAVVWKPNGEKCPVTNLENGSGVKVDDYYEDGKEVIRSTYKDGERVYE